MEYAKQYLINSWFSLILIGETKLWFSGAVGSFCMIGAFTYTLVITITTVSYTISDWVIAFIVVFGGFPFLLTLLFGYVRKKFRYPSITSTREFNIVEFYRVMGMVWLLNILGIVCVFILFAFILKYFYDLMGLSGSDFRADSGG